MTSTETTTQMDATSGAPRSTFPILEKFFTFLNNFISQKNKSGRNIFRAGCGRGRHFGHGYINHRNRGGRGFHRSDRSGGKYTIATHKNTNEE